MASSEAENEAESATKSVAKKRGLIDEFDKNRQSMLLPYKPAKLYNANGDLKKRWYIEYYYIIPGTNNFKRIKEGFKINRYHTLKDRTDYGNEFVKFLNEKLKRGFNPFVATKVTTGQLQIKIKTQLFQIKTALSAEAPSDYAISSYTENYNRLVKFLEVKSLDDLVIGEFSQADAKEYKKWLLATKLAKKTINSSLSYLSQYWEAAISNRWANHNPFKAIPRVSKNESVKDKKGDERFEPLTAEEINEVFSKLDELQEHDFKRYLLFIFYAWARPVEIIRLRVHDIELGRQLIRFKKYETKNSNAAYVQIVPPLLRQLKKNKFQDFAGNDYLFSYGFKPGKQQVSKHYGLKK